MKTIITIVLACITTLCSYGQQSLELKMKKSSDAPNTDSEHTYLIEVVNTLDKQQNFTIVTTNVACENIMQSKQVQLNKQVLNTQNKSEFKTGTINGKSSKDFYIKISRNPDTPIGKWNCIEIRAVSNDKQTISNTLIIKSQIPDPKNFN